MPQAALAVAAQVVITAVSEYVIIQVFAMYLFSTVMQGLAKKDEEQPEPGPIKTMIRSSSVPLKIIYGERQVSGPVVYWKAGGPSIVICIALCNHEIEEVVEYFFDDKAATGLDKGFVTEANLGTLTQTALPLLISFGAPWSINHKGTGIAHIAVQLTRPDDWDKIPNISCSVKGAKVYDPRKDNTTSYYVSGIGTHRASDSATWEYSSNPALHARDYITSVNGVGVSDARIDEDYTVWSANECDEQVNTPAGMQNKYECNVVLSTADPKGDNLRKITGSMAGAVGVVGGIWRIRAGGTETPEVTITDNDIISEYTIMSKLSKRELYNYVTGRFYDRERTYQVSNFSPRDNPTFETRDGRRISVDLSLEATTDKYFAQRLAIIHLKESAHQAVVSFIGKPSLFDVAVGDLVYHTTDNPAWSQKLFRILKWELKDQMQVAIVMREEYAATYDVDVGEYDTISYDAGATPYDPTAVVDTTGLAFFTGNDASYEIKSDGTVITGGKLTWDLNSDQYLDGYIVSYRVAGGAPENEWIDTFIKGKTITETFIPLNTTAVSGNQYDFRVYAINERGASNLNPAELADRNVTDKSTGPDQLGAISGQKRTGGAFLTVDTASVNDRDLLSIQYAHNLINNVTDGGVTLIEVPCPRSLDNIPVIGNGIQMPHNSYVWARLKNTVGVFGSWNTANTNGTLVSALPEIGEQFGIQGSNLISSEFRASREYPVGDTSVLGPYGQGLSLGNLGLEIGDPVSMSIHRAHLSETTGALKIIFRDISFVEISNQTCPNIPDESPVPLTKSKVENILIPAGTIHLELVIVCVGGSMTAKTPIFNKGFAVHDHFGSIGDRLLDPNDPAYDLGMIGDNQNLLDGTVETNVDDTAPGTGSGGGPYLPPGSPGGGWYIEP